MTHGNIRYPKLHDKAALEELVKQYGSAARIARALGCKRQNVDAALKGFGIHTKMYVTSDKKRKQFHVE